LAADADLGIVIGDLADPPSTRALAHGSIPRCWVGIYIEKGEVVPPDMFFLRTFNEAGFQLRIRIIWHFEHGLHASRRLSRRYETIR